MSNINISNLSPSGSELFHDSESYMTYLTDNEFESVHGGATMVFTAPAVISSKACITGAAFVGGIVAGWTAN